MMANNHVKQVSQELEEARRAQPFHQRANASSPVWGTGVFNVEDKVHNAASTTSTQLLRPQEQTPSVYTLPLAPRSSLRSRSGWRGRYPSVAGDNRRSSSPALSSTSSSAVSAATTSATFSSRSSLSSCRSSVGSISQYTRRGSVGKRRYLGSESSSSSSRSSSRPCVPGGSDYFPTPSPWAGVDGRRRRSDGGRRERSAGRELNRHRQQREKQGRRYASDSRKDYASEASTPSHDGRRCGSRDQGMKRSRSGSRERGSRRKKAVVDAGIECSRCTERCRVSRERSTITRTLPMEYWVRTARCKAAKSKHIDYIDNVAYSREQFIEQTVFTCPFTGVRRDIVLERNMFPYDVPSDVEHWTLWSRNDLTNPEMEEFVQRWTAVNHPHVVEWECDNNEGDRSIDWYHVHVFFRLGCEDRSGAQRDPDSVYDGPCSSISRSSDGERMCPASETCSDMETPALADCRAEL